VQFPGTPVHPAPSTVRDSQVLPSKPFPSRCVNGSGPGGVWEATAALSGSLADLFEVGHGPETWGRGRAGPLGGAEHHGAGTSGTRGGTRDASWRLRTRRPGLLRSERMA
jgi:hypothetical protein